MIQYKDINPKNIEKDIVNVDTFYVSLKNIVSTTIGDIAGFPEFSNNAQLLFDQYSSVALDAYKTSLKTSIQKFDYRIIVDNINISKGNSDNSVYIEIKYRVKDTTISDTASIKVG
ncbi:putative baseplate wedge subunit [Campylobacter phage F356]|uniref:Putative baseplate wedge subunit n=14 Tax=Fletchervirus TaxID=1636618 RepID=A0A7T3N2M9_9CAUD|nr:putative baseplate wedge subunit [Campylobacter phage F207]QPX63269.1 putative baseplate wedge subunit [Campylobacter phage F348]QPX63434.1 putative baseplate wedge subunit [Campylobacter phage F352]QPX63602.1 putative baseplate wedge subunit [Campylobacter phage F355]QPX63703.1 putative baseplate wedge subunit [Campylobacter phage F356]QPX63935.1 putative baseplate wedge subunit [Campylobacter phage F357]QPX64098.1 putative baseplate wedge subunit [Campylobacter phage F358]QPX64261.1 put